MSEAEEQEQEQVNTQEGLEFYQALQDFFGQDPRFLIWVLHVLADETNEAIRYTANLPADVYELIGRIHTVHELYWHTDKHEVVQNVIADSETRLNLMKTITLLANIYATLKKGTDIDPMAIREKLDDATRLLYASLKAVIDYAEEKVESPECPDP